MIRGCGGVQPPELLVLPFTMELNRNGQSATPDCFRFAIRSEPAGGEAHDPVDDYTTDAFRGGSTVRVERANTIDCRQFPPDYDHVVARRGDSSASPSSMTALDTCLRVRNPMLKRSTFRF